MIELLLIRQIAILIASGIGSYTDYKTGYIFDWITLPLIGFGIVVNVFDQNYYGLLIGAIVFVIGYLLYYTGKIGGGDVKLYSGIALALPVFNGSIFIITVIILSSLSAIVFLATYYFIKYYRKGIDFKYNKQGILRAAALAILITVYLAVLLNYGFVGGSYALIVSIPLLFGTVFIAFEKGIRKEFFLEKIKLKNLEEDEIVAFEFMDEEERKKIGKGFKGVFGAKEKKELEKKGIKELLVYRNLPRFGVFIFIGVVLALAFPEFGSFLSGGF